MSDRDRCHWSTLGDVTVDHHRNVRTTWLYTLGSIVAFVGFFSGFIALMMLAALAVAPTAALSVAIVLQLVAGVVQIRFCWYLRGGRGAGMPGLGPTLALFLPAAAVWVLTLFAPGVALVGAASLWVALCLAACLVGRRRRWELIALGAILLVGHTVLAERITPPVPGESLVEAGTAWATVIYAAFVPFMLLTSVWFWEVVLELDRHRRTAAALAITRERLRFASDLHDIQGHHLQVISLKAELAERLLPVDVEAARAQLRDVRTIAHEALAETRSLVAGYRQVSLDDELYNAREVLGASGARCTLRVEALPDDDATRSALALTVREATTNILRHSEAIEVEITVVAAVGGWTLTIANDAAAPAATDSVDAGSGIAGLRERMVALGGSLDAAHEGDRFVLRAMVPAVARPSTSGARA